METLRVARDGVEVHVEIEGATDAPVVVFLHGVTGSGQTWGSLPARITDGRRIVRVDLRGHGRSDHAPHTYAVPEYAADVAAVLGRIAAPGAATLVGHSLGGVVAWSVIQSHPDLAGAAFLEDPPLFAPDMDAPRNAELRRRFEMIRDGALAARANGTSEAELADRIGASPMRSGPDGPTFLEVCFEDTAAASAFAQSRMDIGVVEGAIDGSTLTGVDLVTPLARPVLILAADERAGGVFTIEHAELLARSHPDVEVVRIDGCGHLMHDERRFRAVFAEQLAAFLDAHAPVGEAASAHR